MARLAVIEGVSLYMYPNDHPPAHFHAALAEYRAVFDLGTLEIRRGQLPRAKARAVVAWARPRREQLLQAWSLSQSGLPVGRIE